MISFRRIGNTPPCDGKAIGSLGYSRSEVRQNMIPSFDGPVMDNDNSDKIDLVDVEGLAGIQVHKNAEAGRIFGENEVSCTERSLVNQNPSSSVSIAITLLG